MKISLTAEKKPLCLKALLIMKLTTILIICFTLQVSAKGFGQKRLNLQFQKTEIARILTTIEKSTSYRFLYDNSLKGVKLKVNLNVKDADIKQVLDQMFANTGLSYQFMENDLIVIRDGSTAGEVVQAVVTGRVMGDSGVALQGVTVQVKGTSRGTTTNEQGNYSINAAESDILVFSYVGYDSQEIPVAGKSTVDVTLALSKQELNQVVVVGYGTQRKLDVTGSVVQVKGEEISKQASINPISALQGKVAGVQITNAGAPGSSPQILIRGTGSILGTTAPLYIVDGVWFTDISFLNPADIENISILKDASAESIYGIRAANGVVLISTKKGRINGKATINYNAYAGWQHVTNEIDMANANQYATLVNEKAVYVGGDSILKAGDYGKGTDWYKQVLRDAMVTSHQLSIAGGSEKSSYNFSLGYLNQDGIVATNNYQRFTASLQNDFQVFKNLKVGYTIVSAYSKSKDIPGGIFHDVYAGAPVIPVRYNDGKYGDPADYALGSALSNPQATLDNYYQRSKNYRFTGNAYAELKFLQHFTLRSSVGGEFGQGEVYNYAPEYYATAAQNSKQSTLGITTSDTRNWILENTLTYTNRFGDHNLTLLAGQSAQRNRNYYMTGTAYNVPFNTSADLYLKLASTTNSKGETTVTSGPPYSVTDGGDLYTNASYFGRINYSFKDRYLVNASIRTDGFSRFIGDQRWGTFPSVGLGWVVSNEDFMRGQKIFDVLKLRGSWGKIGNAIVPFAPSILTVDQGANLTAVFGGVYNTGASVTSVVPPVTYWEHGDGIDAGLEASFLNRKLTVEADWYNRKTKQAIFYVPLLSSVGTSGSNILGNQADIQNTGVELAVTWRDNVSKDFSYSISGNIAYNQNEVTNVLSGATPIYGGGGGATGGAFTTITILGRPIGDFYGYQVTGIFQNQAEVDKSVQKGTAKPGDFIYKDVNGDGTISGKDRVDLGNPNPKYVYGLSTNWQYKAFDLTVDVQGIAGVSVYNANQGIRYGNENFSLDFYNNRWHGEGTSNKYPSANIGGNQNYLPNSFFVEDGSYIRIRNLQLGYSLPGGLMQKWNLQKLRVYANAQNPFNFFKYKGFSPEVGGSPTNAGIDTNVYPLYATYNFGINLTF